MQHLRDNCTTYVDHFIFSMTLALLFLRAACASAVHAVIPTMCTTYASDTVRDISTRLEDMGCKDD